MTETLGPLGPPEPFLEPPLGPFPFLELPRELPREPPLGLLLGPPLGPLLGPPLESPLQPPHSLGVAGSTHSRLHC